MIVLNQSVREVYRQALRRSGSDAVLGIAVHTGSHYYAPVVNAVVVALLVVYRLIAVGNRLGNIINHVVVLAFDTPLQGEQVLGLNHPLHVHLSGFDLLLSCLRGEADDHTEGIVGTISGNGAFCFIPFQRLNIYSQLGIGIDFIEGFQPVHAGGDVSAVLIGLAVDEVGLCGLGINGVVLGIHDSQVVFLIEVLQQFLVGGISQRRNIIVAVFYPLFLVQREVTVSIGLVGALSGKDHAAAAGMLGNACIHDFLHGIQILGTGFGNVVIAYFLQPVHTYPLSVGIGGVVVRSLGKSKYILAVQLNVLGQAKLFHLAIVGGSDLGEGIHIILGQIAVCCPGGHLVIVILHQNRGQILRRGQQSVLGHYVGTGDGSEIHGDVVLITEILLNPLGPVVVGYIRNPFLSSVVNRNGDGHVLLERNPAGDAGVSAVLSRHCHGSGCQKSTGHHARKGDGPESSEVGFLHGITLLLKINV